jgi:lysyl-tRNA synthetase class 2
MNDADPHPAPDDAAEPTPDDAVEPDAAEVAAAVSTLRAQRLDKVAALRDAGVDPYPHRFDIDHSLADIRGAFGDLEAGAETGHRVSVAGRVMLLRRQGKLVFASLRDRTGDLQLFVSKAVIGDDGFEAVADLDLGDVVGVEGTVMCTRKGELSVKVDRVTLLAKAVRPFPDKWKGLTDVDARFRQRYVDLVVREETRRAFTTRHRAVAAIRRHLDAEGFIEVETPILSLVQGGATARPFVTHYNALGIDTYLRIAIELHLKRLIVGGMERVFEMGRIFRNEGIDTRHNPEFTMLEAYQAYTDYHGMMTLTEGIVEAAARAALDGGTVVTVGDREIDLAPPWRRVRMVDLISEVTGAHLEPSMPLDEARAVVDGLGLEYEEHWGSGRLTHHVYDELCERTVVAPTIVYDHPTEVSPLAKARDDDPTVVERFEVIVDGRELANAYSELNDPVDQLHRFQAEAAAKAGGDAEAGDVDLDYIRALEYGMPPTGGLGIGIDRLAMLLAGVESIREVVLFPTLRPETGLVLDEFPYADR